MLRTLFGNLGLKGMALAMQSSTPNGISPSLAYFRICDAQHLFSVSASTMGFSSAATPEGQPSAGSPSSSRSQTEQAPPDDRSGSGSQTSTAGSRDSAAFGSRRVTAAAARRANQPLALEGIVHILNTFNNIHLTLTEKTGNIKAWTSAGTAGFRGSRKSQPVAAERAAEELARRALKLGYTTVEVKLKGAGPNKQYAVQALKASGLNITALADVTPVPYNGCRPPKRRRV